MSNDVKQQLYYFSVFCSWKSSILYSQFNEEKVRLFPFFACGSTETRFGTTGKVYKNRLDSGLMTGSCQELFLEGFFSLGSEVSLKTPHTYNWSYRRLCLGRPLRPQPLSGPAPRLLPPPRPQLRFPAH